MSRVLAATMPSRTHWVCAGRVARRLGTTSLVCVGVLMCALSGQATAQGAPLLVGATGGAAGLSGTHLWPSAEGDDIQPAPPPEAAQPQGAEEPIDGPDDQHGSPDTSATTPGTPTQAPSATASQSPSGQAGTVSPEPPADLQPDATAEPAAPTNSAEQQPGGSEPVEKAPSPRAGVAQEEAPTESTPASPSPSASADPTVRPSDPPSPPVTSFEDLTTTNAGALSGGRQGDEVTLYLPSGTVGPNEWVAVFTFPQAQGSDWLAVSPDRSVVIDIAGMPAGSYKLAVSDSAGELVGWAQLELADDSKTGAQTLAKQVSHRVSSGGVDAGDWLLLGAAGVLIAGATGFVLLTRPTPVKRV